MIRAPETPPRSARLYHAGHDPTVPIVRRGIARVVSAYDRAPIRDVIPLGILSAIEGALTSIAMRAISAVLPAAYPGIACPPPPSGGRGTALAIGVWCSPFAALALWSRAG